jgi:hypothetical protein
MTHHPAAFLSGLVVGRGIMTLAFAGRVRTGTPPAASISSAIHTVPAQHALTPPATPSWQDTPAQNAGTGPGRCGGRCQGAVSPRRAGARGPNGVLGLRLTRLACGKLERALPAGLREDEWAVARAAAAAQPPAVRQPYLVIVSGNPQRLLVFATLDRESARATRPAARESPVLSRGSPCKGTSHHWQLCYWWEWC